MPVFENRLALETSPYLRQHRFDPVDWFPYGEEAFERARALDRPLFLSIGYSACHWCHVMAHESFADPETAELMNRTVVAIKVDREERPDVDTIYMEAVLAANGHGGWPMSVFATPDGRPFFAGTYFPDSPRQRMPSFRQVLVAVADIWANRREDVEGQADALSAAVAASVQPPPPVLALESEGEPGGIGRDEVLHAVRAACERLGTISDPDHGGFGRAPKFPQPLLVDLLLRAHAEQIEPAGGPPPLSVALGALEAMASGGIYDHLGGGFSRYSVDREWLVPHFEKMLYDQALLARAALHAWQLTEDTRWRQVLDETLGYVLRDLRHPSGGLCASEDADSEGVEGKFYLWDLGEIEQVLPPRLLQGALEWWGVSPEGNFEGRNILHRPVRGDLLRPQAIEEARLLLLAARSQRVRPGLDDKVVVEWNAMMASVMAEAAAATGDERYEAAAREIVAVLLASVAAAGGRVPRLAVRTGEASPPDGFALDVAWLAEACTRVFELDGDTSMLVAARDLAEGFVSDFVDEESGVVHTTRADSAVVVARPAEFHDGVTPSAASVGALMLARLAVLLGDERCASIARRIVSGCSAAIESSPSAVPELLSAGALLSGAVEVVAIGTGREIADRLRRRYRPRAVFVRDRPGERSAAIALPLLEGRHEDAVYICRDGECRLPARGLAEAEAELAVALGESSGAAP